MNYQNQLCFTYSHLVINKLVTMNIRLVLIAGLFLFSCTSKMPSRIYKSSDEVTGGFYNFSLNLKGNGLLELDIKTSKQTKQSQAGVEWESNENMLSGRWFKDNKTIKYVLDKPNSFIDSIFLDTDFNFNSSKRPVISFSSKIDTAFIYGIPCAIIKSHSKVKDSLREGH